MKLTKTQKVQKNININSGDAKYTVTGCIEFEIDIRGVYDEADVKTIMKTMEIRLSPWTAKNISIESENIEIYEIQSEFDNE